MRHCFDFIDFQNAQIGFPAMEFEQWVVVGTEISRRALSANGFIEHPTESRSIDVTALDAEADDAALELIHDHQYPVTLKNNGFASKEIDILQTIFRVSDKRQP